ncbi:arylesterase [Rhodospirillum rubrum]|uniref:arylesterase n=1 Tax=Rhodospirillum rubrum TaxID=1085 RepID=UPI001F5B0F0F|nr:arylesterase [Rhodospirillum rubrum]
MTILSTPTGKLWRYGARPRLIQAVGIALSLMIPLAGPASAADPIVVSALGDSLTAGYNLPPEAAFPVQLEAALRARGHDVRVINAGVSGDTSAGGLARLDWMLGDHPQAVIVELGANDGLRGLDPARTRENLDSLLARLKAEGLPVLLTGMLAPPNLGRDYGAAFNGLFPDLAKKYDTLFYPFFLDGVARDPALTQPDGLHPTAEGVALIVARILPQAEALIAQARKAASP